MSRPMHRLQSNADFVGQEINNSDPEGYDHVDFAGGTRTAFEVVGEPCFLHVTIISGKSQTPTG